MKTAKEVLMSYNASHDWPVADEGLIDTLGGSGKVVWEGSDDVHRWYIVRPTVKEFDGEYIYYFDYVITGDNSMSDMGLEYDLESAKVVEKKERVVTEVYYE